MAPFRIALVAGALALIPSACAVEEEAVELGGARQPIIGGRSTGEYAAAAAIVRVESDGSFGLCSGALISPRLVLTAAHCVAFADHPPAYRVAFGRSIVPGDPATDTTFIDVPLDNRYQHAEYERGEVGSGYDLGLVLLPEAAPVAPMPVLRAPLVAEVGDPIQIIGWGVQQSGPDARGATGALTAGVKKAVDTSLTARGEVLLSYGSVGAGTCVGDSGGPGIMAIDGVDTVVSVHAQGSSETCSPAEGFGTRIDIRTAWLERAIEVLDPEAGLEFSADPDVEQGGDVLVGCSAGGGADRSTFAAALALAFALAWFRRRYGV